MTECLHSSRWLITASPGLVFVKTTLSNTSNVNLVIKINNGDGVVKEFVEPEHIMYCLFRFKCIKKGDIEWDREIEG